MLVQFKNGNKNNLFLFFGILVPLCHGSALQIYNQRIAEWKKMSLQMWHGFEGGFWGGAYLSLSLGRILRHLIFAAETKTARNESKHYGAAGKGVGRNYAPQRKN